MRQDVERACNGERPVLAFDLEIKDTENPYRARDAVTIFEPTPSERGPLQERGEQACPLRRKESLRRLRDPHLVIQVQTGTGTRHNGRGCFLSSAADGLPRPDGGEPS